MKLFKIAQSYIAYHGTNASFHSFDPSFGFDETKAMQEGPGVYLTSNLSDAQGYGKNVMMVKLDFAKALSSKSKIKDSDITYALLESMNIKSVSDLKTIGDSFWETVVSNFGEDPISAFYLAKQHIIERSINGLDLFQNIWITYFRYQPDKYLKIMKDLGYDGNSVTTHYVVYNPNIINVIYDKNFLHKWPKNENNDLILYRGNYSGNKNGNFFTSDKEWARQFTQSGLDSEIGEFRINSENVYEGENLPEATDVKGIEESRMIARKNGKGAFLVDEGSGQPKSIFVMDKKLLRSYE